MHVARPLGRAHAHHGPLRPGVPAPAALVRQVLAHVVPHLLGVDQQAVHIEDDRRDHRRACRCGSCRRARSPPSPARGRAPRRRRACGRRSAPRRSCARGASRRRRRSAVDRPRAPGSRPRARAAARCGRSAARARPARRRGSTQSTPRLLQHLVERGDVRERDRDERRVERERDQRGDGEPRATPARLGDDDGDAGRPAPEQLALLGSKVARLELLHAVEATEGRQVPARGAARRPGHGGHRSTVAHQCAPSAAMIRASAKSARNFVPLNSDGRACRADRRSRALSVSSAALS